MSGNGWRCHKARTLTHITSIHTSFTTWDEVDRGLATYQLVQDIWSLFNRVKVLALSILSLRNTIVLLCQIKPVTLELSFIIFVIVLTTIVAD